VADLVQLLGFVALRSRLPEDLPTRPVDPPIADAAAVPARMSGLCQFLTHALQQMSALLDHLVGTGEQRWW